MAKAQMGGVVAEISGVVGEEVAVAGRSGINLRRKPTYHYPDVPALQPIHDRMRQVMATWNSFDRETAMAWHDYAQTVTHTNDLTGQPYHPTGLNAFSGLANKFLQVTPSGDIPTLPPAQPFGGDKLVLTVRPYPIAIVLTASGPSAPNVLTELLVQKLANPRRLPGSFYKSAGFYTFTSHSLQQSFLTEEGTYACAYRFVHRLTGQMTMRVTADVVQVG